MRRSIFALSIMAGSLALVACEDGPTQVFSPAPPGAGNNFNNGNTDAAYDPGATQGFGQDGGGGATKQDLCPGDVKAKKQITTINQVLQNGVKVEGT